MRRRMRASVAIVLLAPAALGAQRSTTPRLGDVVASVTAAARRVDFAAGNPAANAVLDSVAARLSSSPAEERSLAQVASVVVAPAPSLGIVARWDRDDFRDALDARLVADVNLLRQIAMTPLRAALEARLGTAATDSLLAPVDSLHAAVLRAGLARNEEKLRRYAIKYGPGSPSLNAVEVLLNYGAQRLPAFGPSRDGWPGPLEVVASWSTTDLTVGRDAAGRRRPRLVPAADLGIRVYRFGNASGAAGRLQRLLHPAHVSSGVALMGGSDAPLSAPWSGRTRMGAFVAWGDLVAGFVGGREPRVLLGRDLPLVPYLF